MPDTELYYDLGTISVDVSGNATLSGAMWSSVNVRPWDMISVDGGDFQFVHTVVDTLHGTILKWADGVKTNVAYVVVQSSPLRYVGGKSMADVDDMLRNLNTDGWYRYVNPFYGNPTAQGLVANDGQFALLYTTGQLWIMTGGLWVLVGVYKGLSPKGAWNSATAYSANDVVTLNGTSYLALAASTNQTPPNATYWQVLASKGDIGPATLKPLVAWATATAYVTGPPASYVSINGSSYSCAVAHTSGTFATDLAAGKWVVVAVKGLDAPTLGGTSTTALTLGIGTKAFVTQTTLAYQIGARVRATSASDVSKWMEGPINYTNGSSALTMSADKFNGTGTISDWNFNTVGQPGAGDLSSANALSELTAVAATARTNIGINQTVSIGAVDLNTIVAPGTYYCLGATSTNGPVAGGQWYLEVIIYSGAGSGYLMQRATNLTGDATTYVRTMFGSAWQPWRRLIDLASNVAILRGHLAGLRLSTAGSSTTFNVAAGSATDSGFSDVLTLVSSMNKTTAAWAAGTGNGSLDTGSISNATFYHVFLIKRPDTGAVDVLISGGAGGGTPVPNALPTNYTLYRRIGGIKTDGAGNWLKFVQTGDNFMWDIAVSNVNVSNPGTSGVLRTVSTPGGVITTAILAVAALGSSSADNPQFIYVSDPAITDTVAGLTGFTVDNVAQATGTFGAGAQALVNTNTASQVRSRLAVSGATTSLFITTLGWIDRRGQDA